VKSEDWCSACVWLLVRFWVGGWVEDGCHGGVRDH
jgi:hypothetical protein